MKTFKVEIKIGDSWVCVDDFRRQIDALHYVRENSGERYPLRILRIEKTVVFEDKKK